jgi:hypothetical protein
VSEARDSQGPRAEYARRLEAHATAAGQRRRLEARLSNLRLAVFVALAAAAWLVLGAGRLPLLALLPPAAVFAALVVWHDRSIRRRERDERAADFYERGLARVEHRFAGTGEPGERHRDPHHAYAEDLDLFGRGSLFELLCMARTHAGENVLAAWLLAPAGPDVARARQGAVAELRERLDLREDMALLGSDVRAAALEAPALRAWGEAPPVLRARLPRVLAPILSALTLAGLAAFILSPAGPIPFLLAGAVQAGYAAALRRRVLAVVASVDAPTRDLDLLASLLERLERERFDTPLLSGVRAALETEGLPASRCIASLHRRVELLDARRNQFFAPIGALLLWTTQLALAVEAWRTAYGGALGRWIEALAELEALASLSGYAYEHPDHVFPEIVAGSARFEGQGLGHPLLAPDTCVRNDVALGGERRALVVSGSNMSGKSTLLRTVGVNAVLAQAGAPVCAEVLRLSSLSVGASIRVVDSLQEGASHFYAEILRIRKVMELADAGPTLFLLDEIFHGTNSHDRGIGAEAVLRGLLERGALGLVTTHDLALARVAEALAPRVANVHFEDHLEDGRIAFDYSMRPGVVRKSNALALMRAVGLPV